MNYWNLIPALLFASVGLVAIVYIGKATLSHLFNRFDPLSYIRGSSLRRKSRSLQAARTYFESRNLDRCVRSLKESLFLEPALISLSFLDAAYDHNFDVLAFILSVNEAIPDRLTSLPQLETLLQERLQLHRSLAESYLSLDLIKSKRKEEGKKTPDWAISEFQKKIASTEEELLQNAKDFNTLFTSLCEKILRSPDESQLTYH